MQSGAGSQPDGQPQEAVHAVRGRKPAGRPTAGSGACSPGQEASRTANRFRDHLRRHLDNDFDRLSEYGPQVQPRIRNTRLVD